MTRGVDLVFYRSAGGPPLSVQVKSHFFDAPGKIERRGVNFLLNPRVFSARDDLYLLFLMVPGVRFALDATDGKRLRSPISPGSPSRRSPLLDSL
jgi:hypothetical protein